MGLQDFQILARPLYSIMPTPIGYSVVAESPYPYNRWHSGIVKAWVEFGEGVSGMGILKALGGGGKPGLLDGGRGSSGLKKQQVVIS